MIHIRTPQTEQEWDIYYDLRYRILREPWGKERGSERNEGDAEATHIALWEDSTLIGVARLDLVEKQLCQARFVAVENNFQGKGYGKQIMAALEEEAIKLGYQKITLHAREIALPFYQKLGYTLVGPSYKLFDQIQHFEMFKQLTK